MADESIRDGNLNDEDDVLLDQAAGDGHSAFLDDEELHDRLPDEANADERTALTAAHRGARATAVPTDVGGVFSAAASSDGATAAPPSDGGPTIADGDNAASDAPQDETGAVASRPDQVATAAQGNADGLQEFILDPAGSGDGGHRDAQIAGPSQGDSQQDRDRAQSADQEAQSQDGPPQEVQGGSAELIGQDQPGQGGDDGQDHGGGVNPIIGDRFDNELTGTDGRDMINAMDGDDIASGGAGDDLIMGKKGDDTLEGGVGDDTMKGGHGDDTFVFTDADFDGAAWTDTVDGLGEGGKPASDYDSIDLSAVGQGWVLEVDGEGQVAASGDNPSEYTNGGDFSGTITFEDGSTVAFDHIERIDW